MPSKEADVMVGRRCLAKGYVDQACASFSRNAETVETDDWERLRDALLDRGRMHDMVRVCALGAVAVPREEVLARADRALMVKDIDLVLDLYELGGADRERWEKAVDVLIDMPDRRRQAVTIADRHLVERADPQPRRVRSNSVSIKAVK